VSCLRGISTKCHGVVSGRVVYFTSSAQLGQPGEQCQTTDDFHDPPLGSIDAPSGVTGRNRRLKAAGWNRMTVKQNGQLIGDPEVFGAAPTFIDNPGDIPLVVRAIAERDRRAQPVIVSESSLA
jgi:hypothetical protein